MLQFSWSRGLFTMAKPKKSEYPNVSDTVANTTPFVCSKIASIAAKEP